MNQATDSEPVGAETGVVETRVADSVEEFAQEEYEEIMAEYNTTVSNSAGDLSVLNGGP